MIFQACERIDRLFILCCISRRFLRTRGTSAARASPLVPSSGWSGRLGFDLSEKQLRRAGLDYWKYLQWEVVDQWEDAAGAGCRAFVPGSSPSRRARSTRACATNRVMRWCSAPKRPGCHALCWTAAPRSRADPHRAARAQPQPVQCRGHRSLRSAPPVGLPGHSVRPRIDVAHPPVNRDVAQFVR